MTTIAYNRGVMAGDGRMTGSYGVITTDNSPKVYKLKNGGIAGGAGVPALTQAYVGLCTQRGCLHKNSGGCTKTQTTTKSTAPGIDERYVLDN